MSFPVMNWVTNPFLWEENVFKSISIFFAHIFNVKCRLNFHKKKIWDFSNAHFRSNEVKYLNVTQLEYISRAGELCLHIKWINFLYSFYVLKNVKTTARAAAHCLISILISPILQNQHYYFINLSCTCVIFNYLELGW